jgi:hypothetical protein
MYALIRSLFRDLRPLMTDPAAWPEQEFLLDACQALTQRILLQDGPARPARALFREVRHLFPVHRQERVLEIIRVHLEAGERIAESVEPFRRRHCEAFSRRGKPCQREALPGLTYCPSHKHLVEEDILELPMAAA